MFDHGQPSRPGTPVAMGSVLPPRKELGIVLYERNILGWEPREFQVALPVYAPAHVVNTALIWRALTVARRVGNCACARQCAAGHVAEPFVGGPVGGRALLGPDPHQESGTQVERRYQHAAALERGGVKRQALNNASIRVRHASRGRQSAGRTRSTSATTSSWPPRRTLSWKRQKVRSQMDGLTVEHSPAR